MSKHINTLTPLFGILVAWIWFVFPSLRDEETAMGMYLLLYLLIAPVSIVWGGIYSLVKKLWKWLAVFVIFGLIPELIFWFAPELLFS